jgi:eukaryotic-like serine/threonine-protein kinase
MVDLIGQQVGNYRIIRQLGEGGFAEVYLGEHIYLKSLAAIKMVSMQFGESEKASFLVEARTLVNLRHPHIVQVLDFGIEGRAPFLVMEYAPLGSLRQLHPKDTRLPLATIVTYVNQVASALQYAHDQRLVHRDIKPENMLLRDRNNILLADFGIALIAQSTYQSRKEVVGTAAYMSPEQIRGRPNLASDQYSMGIVVYEWLSGTKPFQGSFTELCAQHIYAAPPPLREKLPTLPLEVERVIQTALAKEPNQRFGSIQEFAHALEHAHQSAAHNPAVLQPARVHLPPATYHASPQDLLYATVQSQPEDKKVYLEASRPQGYTFYAHNSEQTQPSSPPQAVWQSQPSSPPQAVWQSQSIPQSRKARPGLITLYALLALVVLIGGGGFLYSSAFYHPNQPLSRPTVQAKATISVQASPTVVVTPTAPPASQDLYTTATSGTPVLDDSLASASANHWDASTSGSCNYIGGAYHAKITKTGYFSQCYAQSTQFRNFAFQIDMTAISGAQKDGGGIIFRATNNENYRLHVAIDGSYDLVNQESSLLNGSSPAIKTGLNQTNTLTIIAREQHISLYINQQYVADVNGGPTITGKIGVMAVCWTQPTEMVFHNAKVWQL